VVRATGEVALIPLGAAAPAADAITHLTITGETVGQAVVTADGATAVLYSNAVAAERVTVLDLNVRGQLAGDAGLAHVARARDCAVGRARARRPQRHRVASGRSDGRRQCGRRGRRRRHAGLGRRARQPCGRRRRRQGGRLAAAAARAQVRRRATAASAGGGGEASVAAPIVGAFSLLPLSGTQPALIQTTDAPLQSLAFSPSGDRALLTVRDDRTSTFGVYLALFPTLEVRRYPLASPPIAAGVAAAARRGYVAQQHPRDASPLSRSTAARPAR